jgi:hypothetical protein
MDGGERILIGGSAGDARSERNRKFIAGLARGERAGESWKHRNWTYRRAKQTAQAGSEQAGRAKDQVSVRLRG